MSTNPPSRTLRALALSLALLGACRPQGPVESQMGIHRSPDRPGPLVLPRPVHDWTDEEVVAFGLARLSAHVQPDGPVGVILDPTCDEQGVWGYTERCGSGWLIHLNPTASGDFLLAIEIHEWAHCLSWRVDDEEDGHGWQFGIEWARAYRAVVYNADTPDATAVPNGTGSVPEMRGHPVGHAGHGPR